MSGVILAELSLVDVAMIGAVTMLGSVVHGSTGIGLGLVAGPVLLSIEPAFVPGPILASSTIIGCRHLLVERHHVDPSTLRRLLLGLPIGVAAAILVLTAVDERLLAIGVGGLVIVAALALLAGLEAPSSSRYEVAGGAAASFGAMTAALPGPPLAMALHDTPGPVMRPTIAATSLVLIAASVASLAVVGRFGGDELRLLALLIPFVLCGLVVARLVRPWLDQAFLRPAVLSVALAGGLALLLRSL